MKVNKKHSGLILASLIALSFNSHFAQAAKKTVKMLKPARAIVFAKVKGGYIRLHEVKANDVVIKKTGVRIDRENVYIGGYAVNTTDKVIPHVRIFPEFKDNSCNSDKFINLMTHDIVNLQPHETRRFVIMRKASEVEPILAKNIPLAQNCILSCYEM